MIVTIDLKFSMETKVYLINLENRKKEKLK